MTGRTEPDGDGQPRRPSWRPPSLRRGRDRGDGRRPGRGGGIGWQPGRLAESMAGIRGLLGLSSTKRAVILAAVVCALALSVTVPMRTYLTQRGELAEMQQQQQRLREQVDQLEQRRDELSEPANVEAEARRRLRYVRPGETPYIVQLPDESAAPEDGGRTGARTDRPEADHGQQKADDDGAWYSELWRSANGDGTGSPGGRR